MSTTNLHEAEQFRHEALMYGSVDQFLGGTVPFIRDGVTAGEPVLVVEPAAKVDMLRKALGRDADAVMFADMSAVGANPARIIPAWQEFVTRHEGATRLRGIGEPIWNERTPDELIECQRHESLLNVAFGGGRPLWLLCPYDTERLDASVIDEARRSHEFVTDGTQTQRSDAFRGREASGAPFDVPLPQCGTAVSRIHFGPNDLASVRNLVAQHAEAAGLGAMRAAELVVAVNEVATNSIQHGSGRGSLTFWQDESAAICEISDRGTFDKSLADRERPQSVMAPRGLWLANQLCDLVQIRTLPDGTVVRLHMRRRALAVN
ncbi:MAG: anti-sigma factor RsbA family regulatory protein [Candidatus Dormibacteraceae bacterium]